ncbi:hypothetical protein GGS26DRAFT_510547 [Hypomontagnella submonticulosa]|nr:hypothetical protein GGS26DRAFT_510547 [Hypomontagnella submonticulosa]
MCLRRRVYFKCLHEDNDVTPPRQLLYCDEAKSQKDDGVLAPCAAADTLPYTETHDFFSAVMRTQHCEACKARPLPFTQTYFTQEESSPGHDGTGSSTGASSSQDPKCARGSDVFDFDWDLDNNLLLPPRRPPKTTNKPARDNRLLILGAGAGLSDAGPVSSVSVEDFQLFDDEDELEDIGSKRATKGSPGRNS